MKNSPLISYCVFTYNQEKYIADSLRAVLSQTLEDIEIIISDDKSSDETVAIVKGLLESYKGAHKVILNVNQANMGVGGHVSYVVEELCHGKYIILVGGDDCPFPSHAELALQAIEEDPAAAFVDFSADLIDEASRPIGESVAQLDKQVYRLEDYCRKLKRPPSFAPGRIIRRQLFDTFGSISKDCPTEDSIIVFRGLLLSGFVRKQTKLIHYRKHAASLSHGENIQQYRRDAIVQQYVRDLEVARQHSLISETEHLKVVRRLRAEQSIKRLKVNSGRKRLKKAWNCLLCSLLRKFFAVGLWRP